MPDVGVDPDGKRMEGQGLRGWSHGGSAERPEDGCSKYTSRARTCERRAAKAAELGALEPVVKSLKTHASDVCVQEEASFALGHLCYNSDKGRQRVLDLHAFDIITRALAKEEPITETQRWRFWALGVPCLGEDDEAPRRRWQALELGVLVQMVKMRHEVDEADAQAVNAVINVLDFWAAVAGGPSDTKACEAAAHRAPPSIAGRLTPKGEEDASDGAAGVERQREAPSKGFLEKLQEMMQDVFQRERGEPGHVSEASTDASFAATSSAYVSEGSAGEAKKGPKPKTA